MKQTNKTVKPYVNTRISGSVIYTPLSQLPERFTYGPHTRAMSKYLSRRWSAQSYGWFKRGKYVEYNREWTPEARKHERYRWVEHPAADGLRFVGKVHEIRMSGDGNLPYFDRAQVDHNGWYTDSMFQDETVCGEVYQLPARDGQWLYVPAISDPNNDAAVMDFHSVTDNIHQAIRNADQMAEWYAEDEREYQTAERAKQRIEDIGEEIRTMYADFRELARELRANCDKLTGLTHVHNLVRDKWTDIRREIEGLRKERERLTDEPWTVNE